MSLRWDEGSNIANPKRVIHTCHLWQGFSIALSSASLYIQVKPCQTPLWETASAMKHQRAAAIFDLCKCWSVDSLASVAFVSLCIEDGFWLLLSKNPLRLTIPIYSKNISKIRKVIAILDNALIYPLLKILIFLVKNY